MSSPLLCQKTYLLDGRCKKPTLGDTEFCRWHRVINEFRSDLSRKPRLFSQFLIFGSFIFLRQAIASAAEFYASSEFIWLLTTVVLLGGGVKLWADGIIALDYPLSQFAVLAQLLAIGMILEVIGGIATGIYISVVPAAARPIIQALGSHPTWMKYGAAILAMIAIVIAAISVNMLLRRILFIRSPYLKGLVWTITILLVNVAARAALSPATGQETLIPSIFSIDTPWAQEFWQPVLGENINIPLWSALIVGFTLCEIINAGIRLRQCTRAVFQATVWPSFPICCGSPFLGTLGSRYIMVWLGISGAVLFVLISVVASGAFCRVFTKWTITAYSSRTSPWQITSIPSEPSKIKPRQEVYLFLKLLDDLMFADYVQQLAQGISDELSGQITMAEIRNGYCVVAMVGTDANKLLNAAMRALEHYSIGLGSFAVMRRGEDQAAEEKITLC